MLNHFLCDQCTIKTSFRPEDFVSLFSSPSSWGANNLVPLSMLNNVIFRDMRGLMLALFMDFQQMAGSLNIKRRTLLTPIVLGIMVSLLGNYRDVLSCDRFSISIAVT